MTEREEYLIWLRKVQRLSRKELLAEHIDLHRCYVESAKMYSIALKDLAYAARKLAQLGIEWHPKTIEYCRVEKIDKEE